MNSKNIIYSFACLSFAIVIGAAVYEHVAVVPRWAAAVPASLSMYQGPYGINPGAFWPKIHPVTLLLMLATLALFWKTERRKNVLATLAGYVLVLAITAVYFVPELLELTATPYSATVDASLTGRAKMWEILSLVRLVFLVFLAINFFLGLTKSAPVTKTAATIKPMTSHNLAESYTV